MNHPYAASTGFKVARLTLPQQAVVWFALIAFAVAAYAPTAVLTLTRVLGETPIMVELCSSAGVKRIVLLDGAAQPAPADHARPGASDCKFAQLLGSLLPPAADAPTVPPASVDAARPASTLTARADDVWAGTHARAPPHAA